MATHEQYSFEALVSAIRRYPVKSSAAKHREAGKLILKLAMKNKIAVATIRNSPEMPLVLAEFSKGIDYGRGETFRVISGPESVCVVMDAKNLGRLVATISKKDVMKTLDNLSEIVVTESEQAWTTPGVVAAVATELAMNGINLVTSAAPPTTHILIVDEAEALNAYRAIERLSRG